MLVTFFEIMVALLSVYGLRFLMINLTYVFLCRNKARACIAFFAEKDTDINQQLILNEKVIMGRNRAIILVDCNVDGELIGEIRKNNPNMDIYRAERINKADGEICG